MIGIIGGAGPLAGAELLRQIIEETNSVKDQDHLPVLLWSVPETLPDRTEFLEGRETENPGVAFGEILLNLEKNGAKFGAIACNTAHAPSIFTKIESELANSGSLIKLLSIVEENITFLKQNFPKGTRIGILSTTGTWRHKIYADPLTKEGFEVVTAQSEEEQNEIHQAIYHPEYGVKASGTRISAKAKEQLYTAMDDLINRGAEVILLGCTEIPLVIMEKNIKNIKIINTLNVLARALIQAHSPNKLKKLTN